MSVNFSFTKINTPPSVFFMFFKLCKWNQIAQHNNKYVSKFAAMLPRVCWDPDYNSNNLQLHILWAGGGNTKIVLLEINYTNKKWKVPTDGLS